MSYSVSQLARLAGVSVRTLHHYDRIRLLRPTGRSAAGYRQYCERDLLRLQQVLFYRELDVPLARIRALLDEPGFDALRALAEHRGLLEQRVARLTKLIETIDRTSARLRGEETMLKDEELYEGFPKEKVEAWQAEAEARWGDAYRESNARVRSWSRQQLAAVKVEGARITRAIAQLMDRDPADAEVQRRVGELHEHLRSFYEPTPEVIVGLGELYVSHPEFRAFYEAIRPGLAEFMRDAMRVYGRGMARGR